MPNRILVADDERHILRLLEVNLSRAGHEVVTASHGREALEMIELLGPDLIILDSEMPYLDGRGVLKELKSRQQGSGLVSPPVIFLYLAAGLSEAINHALHEEGVSHVATKPIDFPALLERVATILVSLKTEPLAA